MPVTTETKILIVEHDPNDIELLKYELKKGGINYVAEIVENEQDYYNALINFTPDIILCDHNLPSFDGPSAFKIREEVAPGTPFIFVSGNIGEVNSVEYIKNGVTDYALKDKLFTLPIKISRALKGAQEEKQLHLAELERIKITRDLIQRNKDLEQFAYIVSHNLRAPVANIIGITRIIYSTDLDPGKEKQMKEHLLTSATKLDEVIKDLNHILQAKHEVSEERKS